VARGRGRRLRGCAAALLIPAAIGLTQARVLFDWPNTSHFINVLRPIVDDSSGPLLVETPSVPEYYLPAGAQWRRWSSTWNIRKPNGNSVGSRGVGRPGSWPVFQYYLRMRYFSVIALNFNATPALDEKIASQLTKMPAYHLVKKMSYGNIGQYRIWVYQPPAATRAVTR
jgi:hypothetical protein